MVFRHGMRSRKSCSSGTVEMSISPAMDATVVSGEIGRALLRSTSWVIVRLPNMSFGAAAP
jgi:hypothetical protein